ncbi:MAG: hydroxymethylbilane synthase [Eubacteriales bacterium]|nr:hydroxymethylbilane synthase [Eubacteriales bacterium]
MSRTIRVGSRESKLAVIQSEMVIDAIRAYDSSIDIQLVTMKTTGDKILDRTLDKVGGKGLFVKELDRALLAGEVDLTVHSMKDLPAQLDERLPLIAVSSRETPYDVLVLPEGCTAWDTTKPVGCASARRAVQIKKLYPDIAVKPVRGNLQTRLRKLDNGEYGALILAQAGLHRLGLEERIHHIFTPEEILPSACQGILAVQATKGFDIDILTKFHDADAWDCAMAERAFIRALDGGCSSPVASFAQLVDMNTIKLTGLYVTEDRMHSSVKTMICPRTDSAAYAAELALRMKNEG